MVWQESVEQRQSLKLLVSDFKKQEADYITLLQKVLVSMLMLSRQNLRRETSENFIAIGMT